MRRTAAFLLLAVGCTPDFASNERSASATLKLIASAQADFRGNDRDNNGIQEYWTADVAGLHLHGALEEKAIAAADAKPVKAVVPSPVPYRGYFFVAMDKDEDGGDLKDPQNNLSKFAFCAYPAEYGRTGKATFVINEGNTIFKADTGGRALTRFGLPEDNTPYPALPRLKVDAAHLARTDVVAALESAHSPGKNLLWCVSVQLAWDAMGGFLGVPELLLQNAHPSIRFLNSRRDARTLVKEDWIVTRVGSPPNDVIKEFLAELDRRFPNREMDLDIPSSDSPDLAVALAFLMRSLPFRQAFERYPDEFRFDGRAVHAFGVRPQGARQGSRSQVSVLGYSSKEDFTLELATDSADDRLLVTRLPRKNTFLETIQEGMKRANAGYGKPMQDIDELRIPCMNFQIHRDFKELTGTFQPGGPAVALAKVDQTTLFRLDETGAKLESFASAWSVLNGDHTPPPPRQLICDGPFLLMLVKKGAPLPYFAAWIDNAELLCPR